MHTLSWVAWVTLVMVVALATTNPFYLGVILLCVLLVAALAPRTRSAVAGVRALLVFGSGMLVLSLAFAMVNGTYGRHVLFTVPGPDVPSWLGGLALGGPVSGEGLLAAGVKGLAILCVLLAFGVFNGAVSPHRVLRTAPAALFHAGLVATIGLTLLPASIEDVRRIREMRALRGAPAGWRALPPLIVPAVIGGLERSMRLAEAMEARGYAADARTSRGPAIIGALSAPLFVAAGWCWFYWPSLRPLALALAVGGIAALGAWLLAAARQRSTTRLAAEPFAAGERTLALASAFGAVAVLAASEGGWLHLGYNPFAGLEWPRFSLIDGAVALTCAWPALWLTLRPATSPVVSRTIGTVDAPGAGEAVRL